MQRSGLKHRSFIITYSFCPLNKDRLQYGLLPGHTKDCNFFFLLFYLQGYRQGEEIYLVIHLFSNTFFFCFCLLLILRFGDEVGFSAGLLSGSTSWQTGAPYPIRLAARPTRSSYSVFPIISFFGSDLGYLPAGFPVISWLMRVLGHPPQSPKCRFFQGFS